MDPEEKQLNQQKLEEGREISLNLPEPPSQPVSTAPHMPEELNTSDHLAGNNQSIADSDLTTGSAIKIEKKPRINLSPAPSVPAQKTMALSKKQLQALNKLRKIRKHKRWYDVKLVVGTVLVFILIFNSQWFISQFMFLFMKPPSAPVATTEQQPQKPAQPTPDNPNPDNNTQPQPEVVGPQNEIIIPKIGVRAPLVFIDTNDENSVLNALHDGVVHYYGTASPGENGNSVFFGHSSNDWWEAGNYKFIFVLLEKLTVGDIYEIHYNSRKYVYTVTETKVVEPTDLSVLNQTAEPTSTLITCTPPGTSWRRFIVHAKQTSPVATSTAKPAPTVQPQGGVLPSTTPAGQQAQLPSAPPSIWSQIATFFSNLFGGKPNDTKQNDTAPSPPRHLPEVN